MNKVSFFQSLGYTEYEAKTLASLTRLSQATPKQISIDSGVPQNKLYPILKKLEKQNLLATIPDDIKTYKLINIKTHVNEKIKQSEQSLKQLKTLSKNIQDIQEPSSQGIFSTIKGQQAIMHKLAEHNSKVKKEIIGIQRNWKVWAGGLRAIQESIKRGVKVKFIGVINEQTKQRALEWKKTGCQIKAFNPKFGEFPMRFSIFDNKEARLTIGKPEIQNPKDYITIWTKSKPFINMLKKQFNEMWAMGEKF